MSEEIRKIKDDNRFYVDNILIDDYGGILGANAVGIYANLSRRVNASQECFPKVERIASDLCLSEPTVIKWLSVMEYFCIIKRIRIGKRCSNRYQLLSRDCWRKDWEVILNELSSGDIKSFNSQTKTILSKRLNHLISNRKVKPIKKTQLKNTFSQKNSEGKNELDELKEKLRANGGYIAN